MARLIPMIVVTTVALSTSSSSPVRDRTSEFCCDQTVNYSHDLSCDNKWSSNEMNFAEISDETKTCQSPCKEINDDGIILDRCVNVTVNTVCYVNGDIKETRMTFYGQTCSLPFTNGMTENKSSVVLLLTFLTERLLRSFS